MNSKLLVLVLALAAVLLIAGCGKKVETANDSSAAFAVSATGGSVATLCHRGLYFLFMPNRGGIVQVMDSTGKPMKC